jgi:hypothetical protein
MRCAASSAVCRASLLTGCSPTYRSKTAAANAGLFTAKPRDAKSHDDWHMYASLCDVKGSSCHARVSWSGPVTVSMPYLHRMPAKRIGTCGKLSSIRSGSDASSPRTCEGQH